MANPEGARVFGLNDWSAWLDRMTRSLLGMSAEAFERALDRGEVSTSGAVEDLASVLVLVRRLRVAAAG